MTRVSDAQAAERLSALLRGRYTDFVEQVLKKGRAVPQEWSAMSVGQMSRRLRLRFDMTQRQLAVLAGLPHSKVAKIERGQDVRLSTLRQLFAGFGCALLLVPVSPLSADKLRRRTRDLAEQGRIPPHRRYPRK